MSSDGSTSGLPAPADRPGADVVVYDGKCRFCQAQVRRLASLDRGGRLAFLSLHDPQTARDYPDLTHDALMQDMYVVDGSGRRHRGAAALRYLTRRLPRLWLLAPWLHIPGSLKVWQWLYRQVATRRYGLRTPASCDSGTCARH